MKSAIKTLWERLKKKFKKDKKLYVVLRDDIDKKHKGKLYIRLFHPEYNGVIVRYNNIQMIKAHVDDPPVLKFGFEIVHPEIEHNPLGHNDTFKTVIGDILLDYLLFKYEV